MTEVRKMMEAATTLKGIVYSAISTFNKDERYLIKNDLSERCICARFAMHLTEALKGTEYSDYLVDVEYNRGMDGHERAAKRIENTLAQANPTMIIIADKSQSESASSMPTKATIANNML